MRRRSSLFIFLCSSLDLNLWFLYWLAKYKSQPRVFGRRPRCSPDRSDVVLLAGSFKKTVVMAASSSSPAPSGFSPRNLPPPPLAAAPRCAAPCLDWISLSDPVYDSVCLIKEIESKKILI
ncbi:hypothetical protein U1Q18_004522 [Sarracenia purpurea var. burkii]